MALATFASNGGKYIATQAVYAIARKVEQEIQDNFTIANIERAINRMLPGKRNKQNRNRVKQAVITNGGTSGAVTVRNAPVSRAVIARNMAPRFRSSEGKYCVGNREFVSNVNGSTTFGVQEFLVQPGMSICFPWLSRAANNHQKYQFKSLKFTYRPIAPTSQAGRICLAFAIDPLDETPMSKQEIFQYSTSVEGSPWSPLELVVNMSTRPGQLFTRSGNVANTDLKTYDLGKLFVSTSDASAVVLGEIFVEYVCELDVPQPANCPFSRTNTDLDPTETNLFLLPTGGVYYPPGGSWQYSFTNATTEITFYSPGYYFLCWNLLATTPGTAAFASDNATGAFDVSGSIGAVANGTSKVGFMLIEARLPNAVVKWVPGTLATITFFQLHVTVAENNEVAL